MRQVFKAGATSQFVLHGNVFDLVPAADGKGGVDWLSLTAFLSGTMFRPFDVVVRYDRGRGMSIEPPARRADEKTAGESPPADPYRGVKEVQAFLKGVDAFRGAPAAFDAVSDRADKLDLRNQLPRDPKRALEIVDRILAFARQRTKVQDGKVVSAPLKVAVVLDYAHFIAPQGDPLYVADLSQTLIQIQDWAASPDMTRDEVSIATVLIAENLLDLNRALVESPYSAKIRINLPTADEIRVFVIDLLPDADEFAKASEVSREVLADKLVGLSRVAIRALVRRALTSGQRITGAYLTRMKKEFIEKEAAGRLEFLESTRTLDDVAGHDEAKAWLREDAVLLKRGRTMAIPMGYLLTGRIGTGKTYLVECLAGDIGIPCVEMKNFRDKWVGATEGNLEKIFSILHALGQVIVFVDEADQVTGKRGGGDGDSGLSGRIYGMLAKEMSDTKQPRQDHLDLRHLAARPGRGRPQAPGAPRRPHPALPAGRRGRPRDTLRRDGAQAEAAHQARGAAAAARQRPDRRQRDGGHPRPRPARVRDGAGRRGARGGQGGAAARVRRARDRRLPPLGPRRAARAHGPARGQGVHGHPLPARAVPQAEPRPGQRPHRAAEDDGRGVGPHSRSGAWAASHSSSYLARTEPSRDAARSRGSERARTSSSTSARSLRRWGALIPEASFSSTRVGSASRATRRPLTAALP